MVKRKYRYTAILSFFLLFKVYADPALIVTPLNFEVLMPEGGLEIREIEIFNSGKSAFKMEAIYDTTWLDVSPKRMEITAGVKKKLTVFIFIPEEQTNERQGFIDIKKVGGRETSRVRIRAGNINIQNVTKAVFNAVSGDVNEQNTVQPTEANVNQLQEKVEKLEQQVTLDSKVIENLREELKTREIQFVELTQSLQNREEFDFFTIPSPGQSRKDNDVSGDLQLLYDELLTALQDDIVNGNITLSWTKNKICFTLSGKIAFISGCDYLRIKGEEALNRFAFVLKKQKQKNFQLMVIGHTDSAPFPGELEKNKFSNWELSALRAARVVKLLQIISGYDGKNLISASQSSYVPLTENNTLEGRIRNRRVDVYISAPAH